MLKVIDPYFNEVPDAEIKPLKKLSTEEYRKKSARLKQESDDVMRELDRLREQTKEFWFPCDVAANKRRAKERVRERKNTARLNWLYKNRELIVPVGMFFIMGIMYLFVLVLEAIL